MPLVAVALAASMLLHAGSSVLSSLSFALDALPASQLVVLATGEPGHRPAVPPDGAVRWVAPHVEAPLWSASGWYARKVGIAYQWVPLQVVGEAVDSRLLVRLPGSNERAWVYAGAVGPIDPALVGTAYLPPIGKRVAWGGAARVTMYTCVELGGCAPTASGIWPEPGVVAVDPAVIPLGSTVWIQGLGTFLAADTGSLVRGAHLDVYGLSYPEAIAWGVQERAVVVFAPD